MRVQCPRDPGAFLGGTLLVDIPSQVKTALNHSQLKHKDRVVHTVDLAQDSILTAIFGRPQIEVNSSHHQAIDRIGENLFVSATANDGIIEAGEDSRPERFNLGVQWHPEICFRSDELSKTIFEKFISAAAQNRLQKA